MIVIGKAYNIKCHNFNVNGDSHWPHR